MFRRMSLLSLLIFVAGCASASVDPTHRTAGPLPKPDMIIVNDFAVTGSEVKLDQGLMAQAMRDSGPRTPSEEENVIGHLVSLKLSETLVDELRKEGINAVHGASSMIQPGPTTVILNGEFITIDQGNQTARVWVGFGMGGSEVRTRVQAIQNGQIIAQAETATKSNLKPGMLVSLGAGAAAESGAAVAVGAGTTAVSEAFLSTVEADARRTAQQIAKKIKDAYIQRGWMAG